MKSPRKRSIWGTGEDNKNTIINKKITPMQPLWLAPSPWERGNGGEELIL
ncbi:hypothetical protein HMPREF9073_00285 [Capnocytophaga sp. oral taxon 326 str. F0382]|nr:hypothetical protein HMPREF9073_00285 [Capnocytophaga sp. oral taxon 326 str. F0382]